MKRKNFLGAMAALVPMFLLDGKALVQARHLSTPRRTPGVESESVNSSAMTDSDLIMDAMTRINTVMRRAIERGDYPTYRQAIRASWITYYINNVARGETEIGRVAVHGEPDETCLNVITANHYHASWLCPDNPGMTVKTPSDVFHES